MFETTTKHTRTNLHIARDVLTFRQHSGVTPANERLKLAGKHKELSVNALRSRRYLDPKYSRWMSADPAVSDYMSQTEKGEGGIYNLANLNVYHYGGNNPLKYKDPTGEKIVIEGSKEFKKATKSALREIMKSSEGNKMIAQLETSDNVHIIRDTTEADKKEGGNKNRTQANSWDGYGKDDPSGYGTGEGTGSTVYWDPNQEKGGKDEKGNDKRPSWIGLQHELGHSQEFDKGEASSDRSGKAGTTPPSERNSMKQENAGRKHTGIAERPSYYSSND